VALSEWTRGATSEPDTASCKIASPGVDKGTHKGRVQLQLETETKQKWNLYCAGILSRLATAQRRFKGRRGTSKCSKDSV